MENTADQNAEATMRHVIYDRFGERDVLQVVSADVPVPGDDQVLVRVHGAGLNCLLSQSGWAANVGLLQTICAPNIPVYIDFFARQPRGGVPPRR